MKKSVVSPCVWIIASIVAWGGASPSLAQEGANVLKKYRGEWVCHFESPVGFAGPQASIALLRLDRSGNLTGEETTATADPFVEVHVSISGKLSPQANGALRGTVNIEVTQPAGVPDQAATLLCMGMDTLGDRFREMRCLELSDEPAAGDVVGVLLCKTR